LVHDAAAPSSAVIQRSWRISLFGHALRIGAEANADNRYCHAICPRLPMNKRQKGFRNAPAA
jgi:hypothetical protein